MSESNPKAPEPTAASESSAPSPTEAEGSAAPNAGDTAANTAANADPFADLLPPLREAVVERGFSELTAVQVAVLEAASRGENLRISSQTGSGKTLALGFAIAQDLIDAAAQNPKKRKGPRAILIAPTRELAQQVARELQWLYAKIRGLHVAVVTGGTDIGRERRVLARNPLVLVATPGRLLDHLTARALDVSEVSHVVLDEADQMLDMGFKDELDAILELMPEERNSHLVSATFPREVRRFAERFAPDSRALEGSRLGEANADIEHQVFLVKERDRYGALVNNLLMAHGGRCLVFVKRRTDAANLAEQLAGDGFGALPFSGDLSQGQRNRTLAAFRRGVVQILVATDVAARGIDVPDIALVVHGDIPYDTDTYTHRSGRTGRAGQRGRSIMLAAPRAERRIRRLLSQGRIEAEFAAVPTAKRIHKSVTKRARKKVHARMAEPQSDEATRNYATELLERYDAPTLVAELLRLAEGELPCPPHEVDTSPARDARGSKRPTSTDFTAFTINWGHKKGATPARLLAHLCRRGDIDGRSIGAMQIDARESRFEIATPEAEGFFASASVEDPRDPHLVIQPFDGPVRSEGGGSRGPRPGRGRSKGSYGRRGAPGHRGERRSRDDRDGGHSRGPGRWRDDRPQRRDNDNDRFRDGGDAKPRRRGPHGRKK